MSYIKDWICCLGIKLIGVIIYKQKIIHKYDNRCT